MNKINPKKNYTLREIVQLDVMGKTHPTVLKKVLEDRLGTNVLKTSVGGTKLAVRYKVLGECLIKYLKKV